MGAEVSSLEQELGKEENHYSRRGVLGLDRLVQGAQLRRPLSKRGPVGVSGAFPSWCWRAALAGSRWHPVPAVIAVSVLE